MILILGELSLLMPLKYSMSWVTIIIRILINSDYWYYELCFFDSAHYFETHMRGNLNHFDKFGLSMFINELSLKIFIQFVFKSACYFGTCMGAILTQKYNYKYIICIIRICNLINYYTIYNDYIV